MQAWVNDLPWFAPWQIKALQKKNDVIHRRQSAPRRAVEPRYQLQTTFTTARSGARSADQTRFPVPISRVRLASPMPFLKGATCFAR